MKTRRKRLTTFVLTVAIILSMLPLTVQAASFTDIRGHWAESDIADAVDRGLFQGTSSTAFSPNAPMTRAMFVTVLYRLDGEEAAEAADFTDIRPDSWYYDAVCWASGNGIVNGTDSSHFSPDQNITREQMITILHRYLEYVGGFLDYYAEDVDFIDQDQIHSYAWDAVAALQKGGVISGKPAAGGYRFDPLGNATRAEAARVFCLFLDNLSWEYAPDQDEERTELEESIDYAQTEFENIDLDYQDSNGYIREADLEAVLAEAESLALQWLDEGFITNYEVNDDNIMVKLSTGANYMHIPMVYEYREYAANPARQIRFYEPYYTEDKNSTSYFYDAQQKYGTAEKLCERIAKRESSYTYDGWYEDSDTGLASLKEWGQDNIILWLGHGNCSESLGPILFTGEFEEESVSPSLQEDLDADRLVVSKYGRIGVTAGYFDAYYSEDSLSGSLIWLGACKSCKDTRLADVLVRKGASTVIGSTDSIGIPFLVNQTNYFFSRLREKDDAGNYYTAGEALAYAREEALKDSPGNIIFGQLRLDGSEDFRLTGVTTQITGFVRDSNTQSPIPGATVTASVSNTVQSATTDAEGKYAISNVAAGKTYTIRCEATGYETGEKKADASVSGPTGVNFALDPLSSGSVPSGYIPIYTAEEFAALQGDETVILMNDLELAGATGPMEWSGILDGNYHTISNPGFGLSQGRDGWIEENTGTIRNVQFQIHVSSTIQTDNEDLIGVVGKNTGTIENCVVSGSISVFRTDTLEYGVRFGVGGLVGTNGYDGVIRNCVNQASVFGSMHKLFNSYLAYVYAGGISAYNYGTIQHCLNLGDISGESADFAFVGGISGAVVVSKVPERGCGNGGTVTAEVQSTYAPNVYIISAFAEDGYATDVGTETHLEEVTLSELKRMWADLIDSDIGKFDVITG